MSNCIEVLTDIAIPLEEFDLDGFERAVLYANSLSKDDVAIDKVHTLEEYILWWFVGNHSYRIEDDLFVLRPGIHRSCHTERDFRQLGMVLGRYIRYDVLREREGESVTVKCRVKVKNEFDQFKKAYHQDLCLFGYPEPKKEPKVVDLVLKNGDEVKVTVLDPVVPPAEIEVRLMGINEERLASFKPRGTE